MEDGGHERACSVQIFPDGVSKKERNDRVLPAEIKIKRRPDCEDKDSGEEGGKLREVCYKPADVGLRRRNIFSENRMMFGREIRVLYRSGDWGSAV